MRFKKVICVLFTCTLLGNSFVKAQNQRTCGFQEAKENLITHDSTYLAIRAQIEADYQEKLNTSVNAERSVFTIPVVVHVVYRTAQENISDAQVLSQIQVLNQDFRRTNTDASNLPAVFQGVAADSEIEFCLATRDPQGAATNGITRTQTTDSSFSLNDAMKSDNSGGKSPWPRASYLNIWVCNLGGGLLGYAYPPGAPATQDGVVVGFRYFGTTGAAQAPFNRGRTATHEVGHWLNLEHIWGDDNGSCNGSDQVADTPNQADAYYECPTHPQTSCNSQDMFMNYMDYVNDACMNTFTQGQKTRMRAVLTGFRSSLQNSLGCQAGTTPGGSGCDSLANKAISAYTELYDAGIGATGYLAGHNSYLDKAKAEIFSSIPANKQLTGVRFLFGRAAFANANSKITVKAWGQTAGLPGTVLAQKDLNINQIAVNGFTNVLFDNPVNVTGTCFVGFEMTYAAGDSVALFTSAIAQSGTNFAYEQFSNDTWFAFNNNSSWGVTTSLGVQAIFCSPTGEVSILSNTNLIDVYPNPNQGSLNLSYSFENQPERIQVSLINMSGQSVHKEFISFAGSGTQALDISNLSNGIYIVEFLGQSTVIRKKIILKK